MEHDQRTTTAALPQWMPPKTIADLAFGLRYDLALPVFPLGGDKRPVVQWRELQTRMPNDREMASWPWDRSAGVAIATGFPHLSVTADADTAEATAWMADLVSDSDERVRMTITRRGAHYYFKHPAAGVIATRCGAGAIEVAPGIKLDIKAGAAYVVAPYSRHPTGFVYQPAGQWVLPVDQLPPLPDVIVRLAAEKALAPEHSSRCAGVPHTDAADAVRAYLVKCGGLPPVGSGSDDATFRAAAWVKANRPDVTGDTFAEVVRECQPAFGVAWIQQKWNSARGTS
jgi:hypothetical protein